MSPWGTSPYGPSGAIIPTGSGGFAIKWVALPSLALVVLSTVAVAVLAARQQGDEIIALASVMLFASGLTWVVCCLTWIYKSWEFLPPPYRRTATGREISPGAAVGFEFVPIYNLYWVFAQNLGYCEALDSALMQSGHTGRAPKSLALACCVVQVIPYLNFLLAPFFWLAYMFAADAVKAQLRATR